MKRSTFITIISLLIPLLGMSQTKPSFVDDVYFKPSDAKIIESPQTTGQPATQKAPNYKNGAKEIIYIDRDNPSTKVAHDTVYVVDRENDSTVNNQDQGYYLNGFNGTESDQEYAERIRRFHNPKYEIFVGDPRYNDIYFLNNYDWNVYVDGSYAYVTPTWTNPYWWNYNYSPYSYGNWGFGFNNWYSPYSYYSGMYNSPWGFDNFYGGYGFGGYGGYGYGYGYGGYGYGYGYGGYGYGGYSGIGYNQKHQDAENRLRDGVSSRSSEAGGSLSRTSGSSREATNQYTTISGSNNLSRGSNTSLVGGVNNISRSTSRSVSNGNGTGLVRSAYTNRSLKNGVQGTSYTTSVRSSNAIIDIRSRTSNFNSRNLNNTPSRASNYTSTNSRNTSTSVSNSRNNSTSGNSTRSSYSSGNNPTYNSSSNSSSSYSGSSSRSSSPSYSSGSSSSGGSSSSSGNSSRSSGGGGGRR